MYCPCCGAEYVDRISRCADCQLELVLEKPSEDKPTYVEYVKVLSTHNVVDVALIKSILEGSGIPYYIADEYFSLARPGVQPARVMIQKECAQEAITLLNELDLNFTLFNLKGRDIEENKG